MVTFKNCEESARKAETLVDLFSCWKEAHELDDDWEYTFPDLPGNPQLNCSDEHIKYFKKSFCPDGITSYNGNVDSNSNKVETLFILKESDVFANKKDISSFSENDCGNAYFWFNQSDNNGVRKKYADKFISVLCAINHKSEADNKDKLFGYMNLNKRGGMGKTRPGKLCNYIYKYADFILKEIAILDPSVIVFCGFYDDFFYVLKSKYGKPNIELWKDTEKIPEIEFPLIGGKRTVLNVNHPASFPDHFDKSVDKIKQLLDK